MAGLHHHHGRGKAAAEKQEGGDGEPRGQAPTRARNGLVRPVRMVVVALIVVMVVVGVQHRYSIPGPAFGTAAALGGLRSRTEPPVVVSRWSITVSGA